MTRTRAPRCHGASSERQSAGGCEHVHLVERIVLEIAAAVGVAGQDRRSGNGGGAAAGRVGELPGAADDFPGLVDRGSGYAAARVDGDVEVKVRADQVHAATGEDEVVPADVVRVGGQVRDLDDPA